MFSRRVVAHESGDFERLFQQMITELKSSRWTGDQIVAQNMELNVDIRAYQAYASETVTESDSGRLIEEFLAMPIPRIFVYGEANRGLSYLPRLRGSSVQVREISSSAHFLFYDNPAEVFRAIGDFVNGAAASSKA